MKLSFNLCGVGICCSTVSLLKIWNLNKCTGVMGVFNCQGAGSWPDLEEDRVELSCPEISGKISPSDIEYLEEVSGKSWNGDYAVFSSKSGSKKS